MSDSPRLMDGAPPSPHPPYERSPRQALAEMPAEVRAAWRSRYLAETEAELRVQVLLDRADADQAGRSGDADLRAAAALAGKAMGLRPT